MWLRLRWGRWGPRTLISLERTGAGGQTRQPRKWGQSGRTGLRGLSAWQRHRRCPEHRGSPERPRQSRERQKSQEGQEIRERQGSRGNPQSQEKRPGPRSRPCRRTASCRRAGRSVRPGRCGSAATRPAGTGSQRRLPTIVSHRAVPDAGLSVQLTTPPGPRAPNRNQAIRNQANRSQAIRNQNPAGQNQCPAGQARNLDQPFPSQPRRRPG